MRKPKHVDPRQGNLFDPPGQQQDSQPAQQTEVQFDPDALDDGEVIARLPGANLARAEALCDQVVTRQLADTAVPALEELWDRFRGFGINKPFREQLAVLKALAKIETERSGIAVRRIVEDPDLSAALLPHALEAAVACRIRFALRHVEQWLEDEQPVVRALAFTLAQWAAPPARILESGRNDPDLSVRKAALITMGKLGHVTARPALLTLLGSSPNGETVRALATVADDEVIVRLGRCADEHESLRPIILEELRAMDDPRATAIARRIERL